MTLIMRLFLTENLDFRTENSSLRPFLVFSYFASHPITVGLLLKILEGRMHGPSHHPKFWVGPSPPDSGLPTSDIIIISSSSSPRCYKIYWFITIKDLFVSR